MKKLKTGTKLIYGTGDFYGGASVTIISLLFLFFLTDVVGLRPILAGAIILIGRIIDAVTDPLMGNISDRTKSRWGRRNPYFIFFAVPVGISFLLLWININLQSQILTFIYYAAAYSFFSIVFTAVMVPYSALAPELTRDYNERTTLISFRMGFSIIGALAAAVVPKSIIDIADEQTKGFLLMAAVFGFLFIVIWLLMFSHMKKREIYSSEAAAGPFFKALISCLKNRAFIPLVGIYLCSFIPSDILAANFIYYLTYYIRKPGLYTVIMGSLLICAALSLFIYVKLSGVLGKRKAYLMGALYWSVMLLPLILFGPGASSVLLVIYAVLLGAGMGVSYAIPWSMLPEVVDADEVLSGERREGLYSGVMTFLRKLSSSVAVFGISYILELSGYVSTTGGEAAVQPESAVLAIRLTTALGPVLFLTFGILSALKFPINPGNYSRLKRYLDVKNGRSDDPVSPEEAKAIAAGLREITGKDIGTGGTP